jgi:hypothetical protein
MFPSQKYSFVVAHICDTSHILQNLSLSHLLLLEIGQFLQCSCAPKKYGADLQCSDTILGQSISAEFDVEPCASDPEVKVDLKFDGGDWSYDVHVRVFFCFCDCLVHRPPSSALPIFTFGSHFFLASFVLRHTPHPNPNLIWNFCTFMRSLFGTRTRGLQTDTTGDLAIPGMSFDVPVIGSVGADLAYDLKLSRSKRDEMFGLSLGVDACAIIAGFHECGSVCELLLGSWINVFLFQLLGSGLSAQCLVGWFAH